MVLKDYAVGLIFLATGSFVVAAPAAPARADEGDEIVEMEPYVVTGSRLPSEPDRFPFPVTRTGFEDLLDGSDLSPVQAIRKLPVFYGAAATENEPFTVTSGSGGVNLLGLGQLSTLTLINGRRAGGSSALGFQHGGFADLNLIPSTAVQSVEVSTFGSSAAYGSDAIAGTVNLTLRNEMEGQRLDLSYGNTTDEDAAEKSVSFTSGHDLGATRLLLFGSWYERNAIHARDRDLTRTVDRRGQGGRNMGSFSFPGRIRTSDPALAGSFGFGVLKDGVGAPESIDDYRPFDFEEDPYNYNRGTTTLPAFERKTFMANFSQDLTPRLQAWGELLFSRTAFEVSLDSAPWDISGGDLLDVARSSPHIPVAPASLLRWRYRSFELGTLDVDYDKDAFRGLVGLRGRAGDTWEWESALLRIGFDMDESVSGISDGRLVAPLIEDGSFNPFALAFSEGVIPSGPRAGEDYSNADALAASAAHPVNRYEETMTGWDFRVRGDLAEVPAGVVQVAAGVEVREEDVDRQMAEIFESGNNLGWIGGGTYEADRSARAAFAESRIPVVRGGNGRQLLELSLAARYEEFEDEGVDPVSGRQEANDYDATVYHAGLFFSASEALRFRAAYGTAFRAPNLAESYGETGGSIAIVDPSLSPPAPVLAGVRLAGNPDLDPEESESINLGVTFEPDPGRGWRFDADYYRIDREDVIFAGSQFLVNENWAGGGPANPDAPFADRITRNGSGTITFVDALWINAAEVETDGIQYRLSYRVPDSGAGSWEAVLGVNQVLSYDIRAASGTPSESYLGDFVHWTSGDRGAKPGSVPEYRGYLALSWEKGGWHLGGRLDYIDSLEEGSAYTSDGEPRRIDEWWGLDLNGSYSWGPDAGDWLANTVVRLAVENVTDEEPPFATSVGFNPSPYDSSLYSVEGRRYTVSVTRKW
jgi:outer membrane receptor protein involved in Fe transport